MSPRLDCVNLRRYSYRQDMPRLNESGHDHLVQLGVIERDAVASIGKGVGPNKLMTQAQADRKALKARAWATEVIFKKPVDLDYNCTRREDVHVGKSAAMDAD